MSDYNSAVRLQLELDELMNQQNTLLARLKDVDGKGLEIGWRDLLRDIPRRSNRLYFKQTSDGHGLMLEFSDNPHVRVKMADINRALDELYQRTTKDTITVVEIDPSLSIDYEEEGRFQEEISEENQSEKTPEQVQRDGVIEEKVQTNSVMEDPAVGGEGTDSATSDNKDVQIHDLEGQDKTLDETFEEDDMEQVNVRDLIIDALKSLHEEPKSDPVPQEEISEDNQSEKATEQVEINGVMEGHSGADERTDSVVTTEEDDSDSFETINGLDETQVWQYGGSGSGEVSDGSDDEDCITSLHSETSSESDIDESQMRIVHVVYDPETNSFVEKEKPSEETFEDATSSDEVEMSVDETASSDEMGITDDLNAEVCQITWAELRKEVGINLTKRCKAFCREVQGALKDYEENIETLSELIQVIKELKAFLEDNYGAYLTDKDRESHARSITSYQSVLQQMKNTKVALGKVANALPQLEAEREIAWPYEEGRPFPNAWPLS